MEQATVVELDAEVDRFSGFSRLHRPAAIGVVRMSFDVHDAVEVCVSDVDGDLHAVGQAVDDDVRSWKVGLDDWRRWNRDCVRKFIYKIGCNSEGSLGEARYSPRCF